MAGQFHMRHYANREYVDCWKSVMIPRQIPSSISDRAHAPTDVWDWQSLNSWRSAIWKLLSKYVDQSVINSFVERPPQYVVSDDLTSLEKHIYEVSEIEIDIRSHLAAQLKRQFRAFRGAHATRAVNLESFYTEGLQPLTSQAANLRAKEIFLGGDFPELQEGDLNKAISDAGCELREGRVYFEGNERSLISQARHYLLYGSEYLIAIAAHLPKKRDYRQVLKAFGNPTMFVCDVPFRLIPDSMISEFAGAAIEVVFQELLDESEAFDSLEGGAGFCIYEALPADCIVGHYHPVNIRDPFNSFH